MFMHSGVDAETTTHTHTQVKLLEKSGIGFPIDPSAAPAVFR